MVVCVRSFEARSPEFGGLSVLGPHAPGTKPGAEHCQGRNKAPSNSNKANKIHAQVLQRFRRVTMSGTASPIP